MWRERGRDQGGFNSGLGFDAHIDTDSSRFIMTDFGLLIGLNSSSGVRQEWEEQKERYLSICLPSVSLIRA